MGLEQLLDWNREGVAVKELHILNFATDGTLTKYPHAESLFIDRVGPPLKKPGSEPSAK